MPSTGDVLREVGRARTSRIKSTRMIRSLDPNDSIGQLLSIIVGRNTLAEGIICSIGRTARSHRIDIKETMHRQHFLH